MSKTSDTLDPTDDPSTTPAEGASRAINPQDPQAVRYTAMIRVTAPMVTCPGGDHVTFLSRLRSKMTWPGIGAAVPLVLWMGVMLTVLIVGVVLVILGQLIGVALLVLVAILAFPGPLRAVFWRLEVTKGPGPGGTAH